MGIYRAARFIYEQKNADTRWYGHRAERRGQPSPVIVSLSHFSFAAGLPFFASFPPFFICLKDPFVHSSSSFARSLSPPRSYYLYLSVISSNEPVSCVSVSFHVHLLMATSDSSVITGSRNSFEGSRSMDSTLIPIADESSEYWRAV